MNGIMLDFHGTLVNSNQAWLEAFSILDPPRREYYREKIWKKESRHLLAQTARLSFTEVYDLYATLLQPRLEIVDLVKKLGESYPLIIVSNSERERLLQDLQKIPPLPIQRIYSKENGRKPNLDYLESILHEMSWERAFLIGNDPEEDLVQSRCITSIIIPNNPY